VTVMPNEKQHIFAITHQELYLKSRRTAAEPEAAEMQLVPPTSSPGPWEIVSWKYDPAMSGGIHIVWRHE